MAAGRWLLIPLTLGLVCLLSKNRGSLEPSKRRRLQASGYEIFSDAQATDNSQRVAQARATYRQSCEDTAITQSEVVTKLTNWLHPGVGAAYSPLPIEPCTNVFLDFGANVGDSLGKLIDAGIEACPDKEILGARLNIDDSIIKPVSNKRKLHNTLIRWVRARMAEVSGARQPEDYCYFGIEGNPAFTERLKQTEARIMTSQPRPVRRAHFFTEHVGTPTDGPTVLYLDTINAKHNFWGSSIYAEHKDVKNSATDGQLVEAPVMGISLEKLLRQTTHVTEGSHVMVKMDIEGAEYPLLNAAFDSGVLCDFVNKGVQLDILVEVHGRNIMGASGSESMDRFNAEVKKGILKCGVNLFTGRDAGR